MAKTKAKTREPARRPRATRATAKKRTRAPSLQPGYARSAITRPGAGALEIALTSLAADLEQKLAAIRAARDEAATGLDQLFEPVADVLFHEPPLWRAGPYASEADFLRREVPGYDVRESARNAILARSYPADVLAIHPHGHLEEVARFVRESTGATAWVPLDLARVRTAVREGRQRKLHKATDLDERAVRAARRSLARQRAPRPASPTTEDDIADIRTAFDAEPALRRVTIASRKNEMTFGRVTRGVLGRFGEVLVGVARAGQASRTRPKPKKRDRG